MGNVLKDQGKLNEAIEAYKKALASILIMLKHIITWAMTFLEKRQTDEAIEAYRKAVSIKPDMLKPITTWVILLLKIR